MTQAWDEEHQSFGDLSCITPCCGMTTSLNDLGYRWPAGFARFVLEAKYADPPDLPPEQIAHLEAILGCHLRITWQHV